MNSITKFNNFIYYPDLLNKFLFTSAKGLNKSLNSEIYLKYILSAQGNYSYLPLKALMMLTSIAPVRCLMNTNIIILKFSKNRTLSYIYLKLTLKQFIPIANQIMISPTRTDTVIFGHINEAKHFIFPGFIKHLRLPKWTYFVNISYNQDFKANLYPVLFHKTAYLD